MSIITKGLGKSGLLITSGYGFRKVIEKIVKVITRLIPVRRESFRMTIRVTGDLAVPFKYEIPVTGDLAVPFKQEIKVRGKKDLSKLLWLLLEEEDEDE